MTGRNLIDSEGDDRVGSIVSAQATQFCRYVGGRREGKEREQCPKQSTTIAAAFWEPQR
jgi:putative hemolysin